jgi:starvation-inducible DNA-binding protein
MSKTVVKKLEQVLADSYVIYAKTQNYHWNVTGSDFKSLHELFGAQYEELATAIDELAERIRSVGFKVNASMSNYIATSKAKECMRENLSANQMLKDLSRDQDIICMSISDALKQAQKEGDEATADMLIGRLEIHQKNKWMLESSVG